MRSLPCGDEYGEPVLDTDGTEARERIWPLVREWTVAYLDRHPGARSRDLLHGLEGLKPEVWCGEGEWRGLSASAVELGRGKKAAFAVAAGNSVSGTVFVVAPARSGRFEVTWNIKDVVVDDADADLVDSLGPNGWEHGPLHGRVGALSPTAARRVRFYVDANPLSPVMMGCTHAYQLSIWEWDGRRVHPLLMKCYAQTICEEGRRGLEISGDLISVLVKARLETTSPYGADPNPKAVWRVRITPSGVEDLGEEWEQPELRFVDDVLDRVLRGQDTAAMIAPEAASSLRILVPKASLLPKSSYLGPLDGVELTGGDGDRTLKLSVNSVGAITFSIIERDGHLFVKSVHVAPPR